MRIGDVRQRRTAAVVGAVIVAAAMVAVGVSVLVRLPGVDTKAANEVSVFGSWAITGIDVARSQHVTVPVGYNSGFSWQPAHRAEAPRRDGGTTYVWMLDSLDVWDQDGNVGCFYTRTGDVITLYHCLAASAPQVNPTPRDQAISNAIGHALENMRMTVANTADGGLSVRLRDTVFCLTRSR
jgi:hypothetical protein